MSEKSFDNFMLIGRAAAGKSEFIDFLKSIPEKDRLTKFHIGAFRELDDFPWLYAMLKDEDIWEKLGRERFLARKKDNVYITTDYKLYDFLSIKLNREIKEKYINDPKFYEDNTLIVEFARGREHAYRNHLNYYEKAVLEKTAIFFLDNTFEESMRRNTVRSNDKDPNQTVLYHKTPLDVMEYYYKTHDWKEFTGGKPHGHIQINGTNVPFVTVWNMPESHDLKVLEERYSAPLVKLWELYNRSSTL